MCRRQFPVLLRMVRGIVSIQIHDVRDKDVVYLVATERGILGFLGGDLGGILHLGHGWVPAPGRSAEDVLHLQAVLRAEHGGESGLRIGLQSLRGVAQGDLGAHPLVFSLLSGVNKSGW